MKYWLGRIALYASIVFLIGTVFNASWLASPTRGGVKLIAHRGVYQLYDHAGVGRDSCTADRIEAPAHDNLENTTRSMGAAARIGADMVEMDVVPTADGRIAIFHDWTLDCRTDGQGDTRKKSLAELKALDIGHGYTADGAKSFPFRGRGKDQIPTVEEAVAALPATPILFHFKSKDPGEADRLAAALKAIPTVMTERRDAFYGAPGPVERIRKHFPNAWAWSMEGAKACTKEYALYGWSGFIPKSCHNGTLMVPLKYQWAFWGWPNRLIRRMEKVGARVVIIDSPDAPRGTGLTLPEQLGKVPSNFKGYVWVDDIWTVGPALRPARDFRSRVQQQAAEAGLKRRRAAVE